jgi:Tfp pilus assembly protein PilF
MPVVPPQPLPTPLPSFRASAFALAAAVVLSIGCGSFKRNENAEGVKLYQQGNYLGAVNHFQQALAQQPGSPDCFYNLGATYHQQAKVFGKASDWRSAEQYYHLCLSRNPNHDACQRALAVLLVEEQRSPEAIALLEDWSRRQPNNPNPQIELARLCQEHGDLREAENRLVDALAIDPSNPRALVALGQIREATGDRNQALADYSRALSVDGVQPVVAARVATLAGAAPTATVRTAALPTNPAGLQVTAPPPIGGVPVSAPASAWGPAPAALPPGVPDGFPAPQPGSAAAAVPAR